MIKIGIECESIESDQTWGVGRMINKLLEEIAKRPELKNEFRVFLYFKSRIPDSPFLDSPIFVKKIVETPMSSFSLYYYLFLPIKLYFEKLDVMFFPNYMLPIIFSGKSLVMLTEDIYYEFKTGSLPFRYKLAYRIFGTWAANRATKIMAISKSSKNELSRIFKIKSGRIAVNQLGIDPVKRQATNSTSYQLQATSFILYVGQAFPRRHLRETMLAFEKNANKFSDYKLVAIGYDKYNPPIIKKIVEDINIRASREVIIYKEYVSESELVQLYANAKSVVYVSSKEAFGLPPIEALAYGSVPIVAETGVTKEIFGDNAFFVKNPNSIDEIAEVIADSLTDNDKRQKILDSVANIVERFSWPAHTNRFLKIIRELTRL